MTSANRKLGKLVFLKLGGSLLTDKARPEHLRVQLGRKLASQISELYSNRNRFPLLLGVGAGSFGHVQAHRHKVDQGVSSGQSYFGAALTADAVARLARQVVAWLLELQVPAWTISPSSCWTSTNRRIDPDSDESIVRSMLEREVIPVVHGDVLLDSGLGASIASTEEIFRHLASHLCPDRVLLAGEVKGVWRDPERGDEDENIVSEIDTRNLVRYTGRFISSRGFDVTGGMASKVEYALQIVKASPRTEVFIIDGRDPQALLRALRTPSETVGTRIYRSS